MNENPYDPFHIKVIQSDGSTKPYEKLTKDEKNQIDQQMKIVGECPDISENDELILLNSNLL